MRKAKLTPTPEGPPLVRRGLAAAAVGLGLGGAPCCGEMNPVPTPPNIPFPDGGLTAGDAGPSDAPAEADAEQVDGATSKGDAQDEGAPTPQPGPPPLPPQ